MAEWNLVPLSEVISLRRGFDLPAQRRIPGDYPILGSFGVTGWHDEGPVPGPGLTIGRSGGSIGTIAYTEHDYWPLNTTLYVENHHGNCIHFLRYALSQLDFKPYDSGSAQPSLNRNYISKIKIPLPGLSTQRAIAEVLGALDDKIAVNEAVSATSEQLMAVRFASIECDVESPDSIHPAADLVVFNPRQQRRPQSEAAYVDMAALPTRTARINSWTMRAPKGGARFHNGDTLLARITPCLENGKTGFVDFLADDEVGTGSTEFIVMRSREGVPVHFPYFLARSPRFRQHAVSNMVGSSGRQRCATQPLEEHLIRLPDEKSLAAFGAAASDSFDLVRSKDAESRTLAALRDALLPELVSGRLQVKDAEAQVSEVV